MPAIRELRTRFVKDKNNEIIVDLFEGENAISLPSGWTQLDIDFRNKATGTAVAQISRTNSERGVTLTNVGVLTLNPGQMDDDLSSLAVGTEYRIYITVFTTDYPKGVVFGVDGSGTKLFFVVEEPTA